MRQCQCRLQVDLVAQCRLALGQRARHAGQVEDDIDGRFQRASSTAASPNEPAMLLYARCAGGSSKLLVDQR
jgi:hypothetical protein